LSLKGQGDLADHHLRFDFGGPGGGFATYEFQDTNPGWRVLRIDLWKPEATSGSFAWSQVVGIRLSRDGLRGTSALSVGNLSASRPETR
jgi:hypothetical protein